MRDVYAEEGHLCELHTYIVVDCVEECKARLATCDINSERSAISDLPCETFKLTSMYVVGELCI